MPAILDLTALARRLREAEEDPVSQRTRAELNPYLLDTVVPLLARGKFPMLADIDFEAFEQHDLPELVRYAQEQSWRTYQLGVYADTLRKAAPVWANTRVFL